MEISTRLNRAWLEHITKEKHAQRQSDRAVRRSYQRLRAAQTQSNSHVAKDERNNTDHKGNRVQVSKRKPRVQTKNASISRRQMGQQTHLRHPSVHFQGNQPQSIITPPSWRFKATTNITNRLNASKASASPPLYYYPETFLDYYVPNNTSGSQTTCRFIRTSTRSDTNNNHNHNSVKNANNVNIGTYNNHPWPPLYPGKPPPLKTPQMLSMSEIAANHRREMGRAGKLNKPLRSRLRNGARTERNSVRDTPDQGDSDDNKIQRDYFGLYQPTYDPSQHLLRSPNLYHPGGRFDRRAERAKMSSYQSLYKRVPVHDFRVR